jgi:hypothetical protein
MFQAIKDITQIQKNIIFQRKYFHAIELFPNKLFRNKQEDDQVEGRRA